MEWFLAAIREGGVQGTFLIVWISVFVLTAVANLLGRLIPYTTFLALVLIRDIRIGHLNRDISGLAAPLLVYR